MRSGLVSAGADGRDGVLLSMPVAGVARAALEMREFELMRRERDHGPSADLAWLLGGVRVALGQFGRTPAEAWQSRCVLLDQVGR